MTVLLNLTPAPGWEADLWKMWFWIHMKTFKKSKKKIQIPRMWNAREGHKEAVTVWFEYSVTSGDVLNSHFRLGVWASSARACVLVPVNWHDVAARAGWTEVFQRFFSLRRYNSSSKTSKCSGMQYRRCQKAGRRTLSSSNKLPVSSGALSNHCGSCKKAAGKSRRFLSSN